MNDTQFYLFLLAYILAVLATVWLLHVVVKWKNLQAKDWYAALHVVSLLSVVLAPVLYVFVVKDPDVASVIFGIFIAATIVNMEHLLWHSAKARWLRILLVAVFMALDFVAWFFYLASISGWYMD